MFFIEIEINEVDEDILLLLSRETMKNASTETDYKNIKVTMLGQKQDSAEMHVLKICTNTDINIILDLKTSNKLTKQKY